MVRMTDFTDDIWRATEDVLAIEQREAKKIKKRIARQGLLSNAERIDGISNQLCLSINNIGRENNLLRKMLGSGCRTVPFAIAARKQVLFGSQANPRLQEDMRISPHLFVEYSAF